MPNNQREKYCGKLFCLFGDKLYICGMKMTDNYKGHRWTTDEIKTLMQYWAAGISMPEIANKLNCTQYALLKQIQRLRKQGIPLERRRNGNIAAKSHANWTQGDVEFLIRRRKENATAEDIGRELGRTPNAVQAMIQKLRSEEVNVPMLGCGVRRLYNVEELKILSIQTSQF